MSTTVQEQFNLDEQMGAVNAVTQFTRLVMLDRVWTDYLQHASPQISDEDVRILDNLTRTMSDLLEDAPNHAAYLGKIVDMHADDLESQYERFIEGNEFSEQAKSNLGALIEREGGLIEFAKHGTDEILKNANFERDALKAKMDIIRRGGFSPGDLSSKFLCGLGASMIGGGLFAPFPASIVGVGAGVALILGMELIGEGC